MSNNYFSFRQFTVRQERCAMKVGTDGTLLGAWAAIPTSAPHPTVLDVGTGTGLIALMMAQRFPMADIKAIDIDEEAIAQAKENVNESPFASRISVSNIAVQDLSDGRFDAIVCNPPFFTEALTCPDKRRTTARHTLFLTYGELMTAAGRLLSDIGEMSVVIPTDFMNDMNSAAAIAGLHPRRVCYVKTTARKPAKRVLLAYSRQHPNNEIDTTTIIIGDEEYNRLTVDFYLTLEEKASGNTAKITDKNLSYIW